MKKDNNKMKKEKFLLTMIDYLTFCKIDFRKMKFLGYDKESNSLMIGEKKYDEVNNIYIDNEINILINEKNDNILIECDYNKTIPFLNREKTQKQFLCVNVQKMINIEVFDKELVKHSTRFRQDKFSDTDDKHKNFIDCKYLDDYKVINDEVYDIPDNFHITDGPDAILDLKRKFSRK